LKSIPEIDKRINKLDFNELLKPLSELKNCNFCPRNCNANRFSNKLGYCNADAGFNISSICIHKGEEPKLLTICYYPKKVPPIFCRMGK